MATSTQWQLALDAARRYEEILVPAILGPAARALVEWSDLQRGAAVLDAGCGTGAATRHVAERVGGEGRVVGIDVNAGMLDVASSLPTVGDAEIEWVEGSVAELPWDGETFDLVLCAQTLQFLADRRSALMEMRRVLKPSGQLTLSLWCELLESPYFHVLVEAMAEHVDPDTASGLRSAFALSNADEIRDLVADAGFEIQELEAHKIDLELTDLESFVPRHVSATPMAAGFAAASEEARCSVVQQVVRELMPYQTASGVRVPFRAHLLRASR